MADQHVIVFLFISCCWCGCGCGKVTGYSGHQRDHPGEAADGQFYLPTEQGVKEFQRILLQGLGLSQIPDISKAKISREEYDRLSPEERRSLFRHGDQEAEDDDPDVAAQRETVILNHGAVKTKTIQRGGVHKNGTVLEWKLRFRPPSSGRRTDPDLRWEPESSRPLELYWSNLIRQDGKNLSAPATRRRNWNESQLHLTVNPNRVESATRIDISSSFFRGRSVKVKLGHTLNQWIDTWTHSNELELTLTCQGRWCRHLRRRHLSAQIRLVLVESPRADRRRKRSPGATGRRGSGSGSQKKEKKKANPFSTHLRNYNKRESVKNATVPSCTKSKCCPRSFTINLREIPDLNWILEPKSIDIKVCRGNCQYAGFYKIESPASLHALFQGYLHSMNNKQVPKLCCAPSKLQGIEILHYDAVNPSNVTSTWWENAIVTECACT